MTVALDTRPLDVVADFPAIQLAVTGFDAPETVQARLEGLSVKKIVVVKDRIVNLVAG